MSEKNEQSQHWTFFTNHSHVMVCLAMDPNQSLRKVADKIGITERAVQKIVSELVDAGILVKHKVGRNNHYQLITNLPLRHPLEHHCTIGEVLELIINSNSKLTK